MALSRWALSGVLLVAALGLWKFNQEPRGGKRQGGSAIFILRHQESVLPPWPLFPKNAAFEKGRKADVTAGKLSRLSLTQAVQGDAVVYVSSYWD